MHANVVCGGLSILCIVFNGLNPASFSFIFGLLQTNINTILQQINVKKMSCLSSMRNQDSNPRPLEHVSSPHLCIVFN